MSLVTITPSYNYNQTCISNTAPNDEGFRMSNTSFVSDSGNYLTESFRVNKGFKFTHFPSKFLYIFRLSNMSKNQFCSRK